MAWGSAVLGWIRRACSRSAQFGGVTRFARWCRSIEFRPSANLPGSRIRQHRRPCQQCMETGRRSSWQHSPRHQPTAAKRDLPVPELFQLSVMRKAPLSVVWVETLRNVAGNFTIRIRDIGCQVVVSADDLTEDHRRCLIRRGSQS